MDYNPFKEAIPFLFDGRKDSAHEDYDKKDTYICNCIRHGAYKYNVRFCYSDYEQAIAVLQKADKATKIIEERLGDVYTVNEWVACNIDPCVEYNGPEMQAYRLRWLNHLAEEWEAEHN